MRCPTKEVWNGDYKCINIGCERDIPAHIVEKQFTHPKNRVCSSCRNRDVIQWKCVGCNGIISNNIKRTGIFYCSVVCRLHSNHKRIYKPRIKNISPKKINKCVYCTKVITHNCQLKFCNSRCYGKNRNLEKHRHLLKNDVELRSKIRFSVQHPAKSKEKSDKRLEYHRKYQLRYRNIKRLVNKIRNT